VLVLRERTMIAELADDAVTEPAIVAAIAQSA
jgi:hypothetical protein